MQGGDVPVSDGFLAPRLFGQFAYRQHRFDQESLAHCPIFHFLNMFGVERRVPAFWGRFARFGVFSRMV
jgi:hypothetical protein